MNILVTLEGYPNDVADNKETVLLRIHDIVRVRTVNCLHRPTLAVLASPGPEMLFFGYDSENERDAALDDILRRMETG